MVTNGGSFPAITRSILTNSKRKEKLNEKMISSTRKKALVPRANSISVPDFHGHFGIAS